MPPDPSLERQLTLKCFEPNDACDEALAAFQEVREVVRLLSTATPRSDAIDVLNVVAANAAELESEAVQALTALERRNTVRDSPCGDGEGGCGELCDRNTQVLDLLHKVAWGDICFAIEGMEDALQLALSATHPWLALWERESERLYIDEFSLTPDEVNALSDRWRLAYVARLITSLALQYGTGGDFRSGHEHDSSPAGLLRGLDRTMSQRAGR